MSIQGTKGPMSALPEVEGATLTLLGAEDPTSASWDIGLPTLSLGGACLVTLDNWEVWQLAWSGRAWVDPTLRWGAGWHEVWSLGRLVHFFLHLGVGAWLLLSQGVVWLMILEEKKLRFEMVLARGVELIRSGDWLHMGSTSSIVLISLV